MYFRRLCVKVDWRRINDFLFRDRFNFLAEEGNDAGPLALVFNRGGVTCKRNPFSFPH